MPNQPLTIHQAAMLMEHSPIEVQNAIRDLRWPSFVSDSGHSMLPASVLAQHWARDLTDPLTRSQARDRLTDLAEAADYPLDLDELEREAARHLRIEHELEVQSEKHQATENT